MRPRCASALIVAASAALVLGCLGDLDQTLTGPPAERTWRAHFGALPEGAAMPVVVEGGFQDPFAQGEVVAPEAATLAWLDGLSSTRCTWSGTERDRSRVASEGLQSTMSLPVLQNDQPSPAREGWLVRTCDGLSVHYRVEVQPDGELRWVLFSWFTS